MQLDRSLFRKLGTGAVLGLFLLSLGCARPGIRQALHKNVGPPEGPTKVIAVYQPWFGDPEHIQVGYSSHDPGVIRRQIEKAKKMGIHAFAVDWYGPRLPFLDRSYELVQTIAAAQGFKVALMYDETEEFTGRATQDAMEAMEMAYRKYLRPGAPGREAYLYYDGRPVIFIFPKRGRTDWAQVRRQLDAWPEPPLLIYKDEPSPYAGLFDGFYAWVHPGKNGWAPDGSHWGETYLEDFYQRMRRQPPGKIVVGGAWPGFDDRPASWGLNRVIDHRCGRTFEDSLRLFRKAQQQAPAPMPFLMIATWNDYEEGTAIERGLAVCRPPESGLEGL